jgi:hypothetical protein
MDYTKIIIVIAVIFLGIVAVSHAFPDRPNSYLTFSSNISSVREAATWCSPIVNNNWHFIVVLWDKSYNVTVSPYGSPNLTYSYGGTQVVIDNGGTEVLCEKKSIPDSELKESSWEVGCQIAVLLKEQLNEEARRLKEKAGKDVLPEL